MSECNTVNLEKAAELLYRVRMNATTIDAIPIEQRPDSLDGSYRLQDCLNRKLASTSLGPLAQARCSSQRSGAVTERFFRQISADLVSSVKSPCRSIRTYRPAVPYRSMTVNRLSVALWYRLSWSNNFFGAGCVLGPEVVATGNQLRQATGTMCINGQSVGSGTGADILGHPYEALCWLAGHLTKRGTPLRAGDYVSLGSVVKTQWLTKGDRVDIEFSDLGHCSLNLA